MGESRDKTKRPKSSRVEKRDPLLSYTGRVKNHPDSVERSLTRTVTPIKKLPQKHNIFVHHTKSRSRRIDTHTHDHKRLLLKEETFCTTLNNTKHMRASCEDKENHDKLEDLAQQIQSKKEELRRVTMQIQTQLETLRLSEIKVKSCEGIYSSKMEEILKGRKEVQSMANKVEKKFLSTQVESEKMQQKAQTLEAEKQQLQQLKQQLFQKDRELTHTRENLLRFQKQIKAAMAYIEERSKSVQLQWEKVEKIKTQHFVKEIQLQSRETYLSSYVCQLNTCIGNLQAQRTNMSCIAVDLESRCEQLEGMEVRMMRRLDGHNKSGEGGNLKGKKCIVIDSFKQSLSDSPLLDG